MDSTKSELYPTMKTTLSLYDPIKEELLKQQQLLKEDSLPDFYSLIKVEVAKQEALYAHFYNPVKEELTEDQSQVYPQEHLEQLSSQPVKLEQIPSPPGYPEPPCPPSLHQTEPPCPPSLHQTEPTPSPNQEELQNVPSPDVQQTHSSPELPQQQQQNFSTDIGQFQQNFPYIPYLYSYPSPYIPFPTTTVPNLGVGIGVPPIPSMAPSYPLQTTNPLQTPNPLSTDKSSWNFADQTSSTYGKVKRVRTDFTPTHLQVLEETFSKSQYMRGLERDELARRLKVTPKSVTIWFQNRRARMRAESRQDKYIKQAAETGNSDVGDIPDFR